MLKILIADDEPLVRLAALNLVIPRQQHGFEVIGEAEEWIRGPQ